MQRSTIEVLPRNLRWEVSVDGKTQPMIDWLCTKERAVEHALERAREIAATGVAVRVVVERSDRTREKVLAELETKYENVA